MGLSYARYIAHPTHISLSNIVRQAAEAYMSLGNVSSSRVHQQYFHEALTYLRQATEIPSCNLPQHLQQYVERLLSQLPTNLSRYLDEYGPLDMLD